MSQQIDNTDFIRRYLLGELSEQEQEQVEQRLLSDDDYYQQVQIAEDELLFDFVSDELPSQDKTRFKQRVLPIPERQQDVRFAKALRRYVVEHAPGSVEVSAVAKERASWLNPFAALFRRPIVGFALASALLLALALSIWMSLQNQRLRNQLAALQTRQTPTPTPPSQDTQEQLATERQRNAELNAQLQREQEQRAGLEQNLEALREQAQRRAPSEPPARTTFVSYLLTAGAVRDSGDTRKIPLSAASREIRLQLDLGANDYPGYRAVLKTVGGQKELLSRKMLRARTGKGRITVTLTLPAKLLGRGDYQVELSGATSAGDYETVETYYFRVAE